MHIKCKNFEQWADSLCWKKSFPPLHTPSSSSSICYELRLFAIVTNNIYLHRYYKCDYFLFISVMFVFLWSNSSMRKLDLFAAERQYLSHNASNLFISFDKNPIFCIFFPLVVPVKRPAANQIKMCNDLHYTRKSWQYKV